MCWRIWHAYLDMIDVIWRVRSRGDVWGRVATCARRRCDVSVQVRARRLVFMTVRALQDDQGALWVKETAIGPVWICKGAQAEVFYLWEGASDRGAKQRSSGAFPEVLRTKCNNSNNRVLIWDRFEVLVGLPWMEGANYGSWSTCFGGAGRQSYEEVQDSK